MSSNRRPWYPWFPKDFVVDEKVQGLSPIAELLYRRALDVMWQANDCQLPNNSYKIANQIGKGLSQNEFEKAWSEIQFDGFELFQTTKDGKWIYSTRLKKEAEKIEILQKKRKQLGRKGGLAKAKAIAKAIDSDLLKQTHSHTDTDTDNNIVPTVLVETDVPTPSKNGCPYEQIKDLYHQILPELPVVRVLTSKRKSHIKARWASGLKLKDGTCSNSIEFWERFFNFIRESDFLMGRRDPPPGRARFSADLEWLTKESNFIKILESKYHR